MKKVLFEIITILSLLFVFYACERMFDNPYDSKANPDSWKPDSTDYYVVSPTICKLSWTQENEHIDGFKIDKYSSGEWVSEYASVSKNDREWYDNDYTYQSDPPVKYRIYAVAGSNKSVNLEVLVNPQLPEVRIDSVIEVNESELHLYASIVCENKAAVIEKGICWATSENPVVGTIYNSDEGSGTGAFESYVSDLPDGILYFRAYAKNVSGINYSENFVINNRLPVVTTNGIANVYNTTATCGGNVLNEGATNVTMKGVCWSTNPNPTNNNVYYRTIDGSGAGEFVSEIAGLSPNTTYYVRAYAENSYGTSYGNQIVFTTKSCLSFTDSRDGNYYHAIQIENQCWMTDNLKFLPEVTGPEIFSTEDLHYYVYGYSGTIISEAKSTENYQIYGVLYNYASALNACPTGWHLPTDEEWKELEMAIGMTADEVDLTDYRGTNEGSKLASNSILWHNGLLEQNYSFGESGFNALPGGNTFNGTLYYEGVEGCWWTETEAPSSESSWCRNIRYDNEGIYRGWYYNYAGYSVRCVKDE